MASIPVSSKIRKIVRLLSAAGAKDILLVGGFARDYLLGISSKDYDLEVYGLDYRQIRETLAPFFYINQVGKSFSVLKVDSTIDIAIPRRESKIGMGHKAFEVISDPNMTFEEAAARRDFTINAIGMRLDGTFCDPYGGRADLEKRVLRATTHAFCEDPLRVLRGMQMAARFGMTMETRTVGFCQEVRPEFVTLSAERLYTEWWKWAEKGRWPEKGLEVLRQSGWVECFPALWGLTLEGKWDETVAACSRAAENLERGKISGKNHGLVLLAVLLHQVKEAASFLVEMKSPQWVVESVEPLVKYHDYALQNPLTEKALRHLAENLAPSSIGLWEEVWKAIYPEKHHSGWISLAHRKGLAENPPEILLKGRDLLQCGIPPGPEMGKILKKARQAQLDGEFEDYPSALAWLERFCCGTLQIKTRKK